MLLFFLILSILLNVILSFVAFNLLRKFEILEDENAKLAEYLRQIQESLSIVLYNIRAVDIRGAFEADDEVGFVFRAINGMVETLREYLPEQES